MNQALRAAMAEAGHTVESLAAKVGVDPKTAGRWLVPGRVPHPRTRARAAEALGREVEDIWPDTSRRRGPSWFRQWADIERVAIALRSFQLAWVPGLFQTEAYARATLAGEALTAEEVDHLAMSRINRQSILRRERPPLLIAVIDAGVLYRSAYGDRALMREQCEYLANCAELPSVQVHMVPTSVGMYPGLGGPFTVADLPEGGRAAHVDGQAPAQILEKPMEIATLDRRWERIRGEALPRAQSLDLIREAAASWT
ncbi:helix-turn-helix transcriptional regulator [Solwaraspora sp. WMMD1047]|uniref:helix-turn-helix domain-containing protein n=1 Tax=Solwaraspora sp. WMMD1047 TaxID=3016102 RepID=UPI0024166786|nr:helix-turn-helix transcriptional regulator [Solwaraspora sp. WMMD1047]MDG4827697.1 helix-turn-helix transcriptional regulator [Solwaraspora sp. WMMD1047]